MSFRTAVRLVRTWVWAFQTVVPFVRSAVPASGSRVLGFFKPFRLCRRESSPDAKAHGRSG